MRLRFLAPAIKGWNLLPNPSMRTICHIAKKLGTNNTGSIKTSARNLPGSRSAARRVTIAPMEWPTPITGAGLDFALSGAVGAVEAHGDL